MSDLWLNLRIGLYHLQLGPRGIRWSRNEAHRGKLGKESPWVEFYELRLPRIVSRAAR